MVDRKTPKALKKTGMGKPRTSCDGTLREIRFALRASDAEWEFIEAKIEDSGLSRGAWGLKQCLRGFKPGG